MSTAVESSVKFTCERSALVRALVAASRALPSRTNKDILRNIKLDISDSVRVSATDLEVGILIDIPLSQSSCPGQMLLPPRAVEALRHGGNGLVDLSLGSGTLAIVSDSDRYKFQTNDASEFPPISASGGEWISLASGELSKALRRTSIAADAAVSSYALGGCCFEANKNLLSVSATDTRRLSHVELKPNGGPPLTGQSVIPSKAIKLIVSLLADSESSEASVSFEENSAHARIGNAEVYSRLVEGRFPDWRRIVPVKKSVSINSVAGPLCEAIAKATICQSEESVGVDFEFTDGLLLLHTSAQDIGDCDITLPVEYSGDKIAVRLDPRFVTEYLRAIPSESSVEIKIVDEDTPVLMRTDDSGFYLVMPLTLNR